MKNESTEQAVSTILEPLEKDFTFWVVVDEDRKIVSVKHPVFGEISAVFSQETLANDALAQMRGTDQDRMSWQVLPAGIYDPEDN